jgi:hypothetical protein
MTANHAISTLAALGALLAIGACNPDETAPAAKDSAVEATEVAVGEPAPVMLPRTASPAGARVFFISPENGDTLINPVRVEFGIDGMTVAAAGLEQENSGHHHLLVDTDLPEMGMPIPADQNHIHFGDASTSTELTLAPGEHTLQLLLADYAHIPHDPPVISERITITVE